MKKRKFNVFKTALCTVVMLALACGSVVFANEVVPVVSSLLKDDYVYVSTYGSTDGRSGEYNRFVPTEKNGVYYLPLREFLNKSNIENDKIHFENDKITIDIYTNELTVVYTKELTDATTDTSGNAREKNRATAPAEYSWSTSCTIGSREVEINGEKYTLSNAPYAENGVTYVPYEYLQNLHIYENKYIPLGVPAQKPTSKFANVMMFGFDSANAEYYTDYIQVDETLLEGSLTSYSAGISHNCTAKIAKTGYRTEFEAEYDYFDRNTSTQNNKVSVKLNKVTRIYSNGSDIEGLFTVIKDGELIYDNEKGCITNLPIPAGKGVLNDGITKAKIGELRLNMFFNGFDCISEEYNERAKTVAKMSDLPDTAKKSIVPTGVKLNGITVLRGSKSYSYLYCNAEQRLADINIEFDNYAENSLEAGTTFTLSTEIDSEMTVIDENTFSTRMYLSDRGNIRLDSFDAIITISPSGVFELKSADGKYIVRGTAEDYVPMWQWSDEQRNAPVPQVVILDE